MRLLLGLALFSVSVTAQVAFQLPGTVPLVANTNLPLSSGIGHYQLWFRSSAITSVLPEPMRFDQVQFIAGTAPTSINTTIDMEVMVAHAPQSGLTGLFAMNFVDEPVIVSPRSNVQLTAAPAGAPAVTIPFARQFTWDGRSAIVIDIKVFGNGQGNGLFNYNFRGTQIGGPGISMAYSGVSASAPGGTVYPGQGLFVNFRARPGVVIPFGNGCRSNTFVTPVASVNQVPWPGIVWNHTLSDANGQRVCALILGDSNTMWGSTPLPFDLTNTIGASGCLLLVNPVATIFSQTVGGSGSGLANLPLQLPPITSYVGLSLYTQWLVLDPAALNGVLTASNGIRSIVAPVGG